MKIKCLVVFFIVTKFVNNKKFLLLNVFIGIVSRIIFSQTDTIFNGNILFTLSEKDLIFKKDTTEIEIITASRTVKNISELPFTIHVITHDEIIKNEYISLVDVLKIMPGIRVSKPGSGEMGDYFEIRGFPGNFYAIILINGLPIKPSVVKGMPLGSQLPIRQAERIEIIYGPSASVYGSDAVVGVINIITKSAEQRTFVRADIGAGEYENTYFNFTVGGKAGKNKNILKYVIAGSKEEYQDIPVKYDIKKFYNPLNSFYDTLEFNGKYYNPSSIDEKLSTDEKKQFILEKYGPNYEGTLTYPEVEKLPGASHMAGIDLDFRGLKFSYYNMYRRLHSSIGHSSMRYKYNNPQNYWGDIINVYGIGFNKIWKKFSTNTQISNISYRMDNNSSVGLTYIANGDRLYRYSTCNDFLFDQLLTFVISNSTEVVTGFTYQKIGYLPLTNYLSLPFRSGRYSSYKSSIEVIDTNFAPVGVKSGVYHNTSAFAQFYIKHQKFRFILGSRVDFHSRYGLNINPRLAILYKINQKSSFRFSGGYAFKTPPPSLEFEIRGYKPDVNINKTFYEIAPLNPLKPELFQSIELGYSSIFYKTSLNIALFYNQIYNQFSHIKVVSTEFDKSLNALNDSISTIINSNSFSRVYGAQLQLVKKNLISSIKLDAILNLMFTYTSKEMPQIETLLENIKLMPNHYGQLSIQMYLFNDLFVRLENTWETKWLRNLFIFEKIYSDLFKNTDGYFTMDLLFSYKLSDNLKCFTKIENIFDEKYNGMNTTGQKEDKLFNPQPGRNIRFGLSFILN